MSQTHSDLWLFPEGPNYEAEALLKLEAIAAALGRIADALEGGTVGIEVER